MAISSQAPRERGDGSTTSAWSPERAVKHHERAGTKVCCKCGTEKPLASFEKSRGKHRRKCVRCRQDESNARYARSSSARLASNRRWRKSNPEKKAQCDSATYRKNRESILLNKRDYHAAKYESQIRPYKLQYLSRPEVIERRREYGAKYHAAYYAQNKANYLAKFIARRELKAKAMPSWANRRAMAELYRTAKAMTLETGIRYEVDHIIPLKGEMVCGLHVETNLRIIARSDNRKKSNRLVQDIV